MKPLFPPVPQTNPYRLETTSRPSTEYVNIAGMMFSLTLQQIAQLQEMAERFQDANNFGTSVKFKP